MSELKYFIETGGFICYRNAEDRIIVLLHTEELRDELNKLQEELEQIRVQLAGCSVAALGGTSGGQIAKQGDYGWSASYQDVLDLQNKFDALRQN